MKKSLRYLVFASLFVLYTGFAFGQCTPDANVVDPDGSGRLDPDTLHVNANSPAAITLTVIAPLTGNVGGGTITIHHITVKSLTNQPGWLSYVCNPGNCEFNAGVKNCVQVTSSLVPAGLDDTIYMDVIVDVYIPIGGMPVLAVSDYNAGMPLVLIIHPQGYGINENGYKDFNINEPQPNPFTSTVKLGYFTATPQAISLKVFDMVGKEVYSEKMNSTSGENYFNFDGSNLKDGVYFYSVIDAQNRVVTKKFVKSR